MPPVAPSTNDVPLRAKLGYSLELLRDHWSRSRTAGDAGWLLDDLAEYDALLRRHSGIPLAQARVFEIGYGARPHRLMALQGITTAAGVDAEAPILTGRPAEYLAALRANGPERLLKSLVRHALFDGRERAAVARALGARAIVPRLDRDRFLVADAATVELDAGSIDLVISEDVFEHIPAPTLTVLCARIAGWLAPDGIALIRPNVFTGITGGHQVHWNRRSFRQPRTIRRTPPWGHLRGLAPTPNTYLNGLARHEYRTLFSAHFEILEERTKLPGLGRELLTAELAEELRDWPDDELFSNQVLFVLRARA